MEREDLTGLSREELLEVVRRQQEALAEREAAIERRDEKIRELEEELSQFRRPVKTPENPSVPPPRSSGQAGTEGEPDRATRSEARSEARAPIRCAQGKLVSRMRGAPDAVVECRPSACGGCGEPLPQTGGRRVGRSHSPPWGPSAARDPHGVTELPSFAPVVIEAWQYALTCTHCGVQTAGTYPAGLEPRRTFGPGIEALLS